MRRRRRTGAVKVNTKLITDVIFASLIVQKAPMFISSIMPLDPMLSKVAGIGAGYVTGMVAKRPDLSNAALALGVTDFVNPLIDQFIGGGMTQLPEKIEPAKTGIMKSKFTKYPMKTVEDYINLNDYVAAPATGRVLDHYKDSY